jgi:DNA repair ATPase RecN
MKIGAAGKPDPDKAGKPVTPRKTKADRTAERIRAVEQQCETMAKAIEDLTLRLGETSTAARTNGQDIKAVNEVLHNHGEKLTNLKELVRKLNG